MSFFERYRIYIGLALILIVIGSGIFLFSSQKADSKIKITEPKNSTENATRIQVDIEGAVKNPGVYKLKEGSILEDLIAVAGGFSENIDQSLVAQTINRAQKLKDGDKIYIPILGDEVSAQAARGGVTLNTNYGGAVSGTQTGKININTASQSELETLPEIGAARASAIITYRQDHGSFKSIDEIKNVPGIGEGIFNQIKDLILV